MRYETEKARVEEAPGKVVSVAAKDESFTQHDSRMDVVEQSNSSTSAKGRPGRGGAKAECAASPEKDSSTERAKDKQDQGRETEPALVVAARSPHAGKGKGFSNFPKISTPEHRSGRVDSNEPNNVNGAGGLNVGSPRPPKSENASKVEDRKGTVPAASKTSQNTEGLVGGLLHRNGSSRNVGSPPSDNLLLGSIQRPDSVSFHSSSSATTSARSFAFPVLSSEWPSSPVRMAGGSDHARFKKQSRWKICCCW